MGLLFGTVLFIIIIIFAFVSVEDRSFLLSLFCAALILRLFILVFVYAFTVNKGGWFFGDEWGISTYAWQIQESIKEVGYPAVWRTPPPTDIFVRMPVKIGDYGITGYTYWVSILYFLFGYVPLLPKIINSILGASLGILTYLISRELFDKRVARLAMILVIFFPSLIFWSVLNLKDTMFIFLSMIIFYSFIKFQKTKAPIYLIFIILGIIIESTIRGGIWIMIIITLFFSAIIMFKKSVKKIIFTLFLVSLSIFVFIGKYNFYNRFMELKVQLASYHIGHVNTEGISHKLLPEKYYVTGANMEDISYLELIRMFLLAWVYFLFVPFIWTIQSKSELFSCPQVLLWYILFLFSLIGIGISLRNKIRYSLILICYIFFFGTPVAMLSGNVGTTFRHRDMLTPFFLIFSTVGIKRLFHGSAKADE
jgi:4-amino-4-deoxy-L-arabinose transferase-like glycosyltransferase